MWVRDGRLSRLSAMQATIPLENWLLQGEVCEHCSSPGQAKVRVESSKQLNWSKFQASQLGLNSKVRQNIIPEERMGSVSGSEPSKSTEGAPQGWQFILGQRSAALCRDGSGGSQLRGGMAWGDQEALGRPREHAHGGSLALGAIPQCFLKRSSHQSKWDARIYLSPAPKPRLETHWLQRCCIVSSKK